MRQPLQMGSCLSPALLVCLLLLLRSATPSTLLASHVRPQRLAAAGPGKDAVIVLNCVPYHVEVLIGAVSTVCELGYNVTVYAYHGRNPSGDRVQAAMAALRPHCPTFAVRDCKQLASDSKPGSHPSVRAVVYVSGQEDAKSNAFTAAIQRHRPKAVLAVIHNASKHRRPLTLNMLEQSHQPVSLLALAEGVQRRLSRSLPPAASARTTNAWLLPTMPLGNGSLCLQPPQPCRTRFTLQGNITPIRRNYDSVRSSLLQNAARLRAAGVVVQFVGACERTPEVPADLTGLLEYHVNLGFGEFYDQIQHSIALVPAVATSEYLDGTRITSTLLTSLITGVPILADWEFMSAYSFLPQSMFYEHLPQEDLPTAMLRVAALSPEKHADVRRSLLAARQWLHGHNMLVLQSQLLLLASGAQLHPGRGIPATGGTTAATKTS